MANKNRKHRYIDTHFWNDTYISELDCTEKLLFIYFLTNAHTNIAGIYEVPEKVIAVETGLDVSMIKKVMARLAPKIRYISGFVVIQKFVVHQEIKSDLTSKGVYNILKELNQDFVMELINKGFYILPDELTKGVCKGYARCSNYSNLDLDLDSNSKPGTGLQAGPKKSPVFNPLGAEILDSFSKLIDAKNKNFYGNKTQRLACDFLIETYGFDEVMALIPKLVETNKVSVWQITSPWDMQEKITKVFNDIKRKQVETLTGKGRGVA